MKKIRYQQHAGAAIIECSPDPMTHEILVLFSIQRGLAEAGVGPTRVVEEQSEWDTAEPVDNCEACDGSGSYYDRGDYSQKLECQHCNGRGY